MQFKIQRIESPIFSDLVELLHRPIESAHQRTKEKILRYLLRSDLAVHEPLGRPRSKLCTLHREGQTIFKFLELSAAAVVAFRA